MSGADEVHIGLHYHRKNNSRRLFSPSFNIFLLTLFCAGQDAAKGDEKGQTAGDRGHYASKVRYSPLPNHDGPTSTAERTLPPPSPEGSSRPCSETAARENASQPVPFEASSSRRIACTALEIAAVESILFSFLAFFSHCEHLQVGGEQLWRSQPSG